MKKTDIEGNIELAASCLIDLIEKCELDWDECLFRLSIPSPDQYTSELTYRHQRKLKFLDDDNIEEYEETIEELIESVLEDIYNKKGIKPKVSVLSVRKDKSYNLKFDYDDSHNLDITFHSIDLKHSYFPIGEIDIPEAFKKDLKEKARWEKLLEKSYVMEIKFLEDDFGAPGPESIYDIKDALYESLTKIDLGRVSMSKWVEDENGVAREIIEVRLIDLEKGLKIITDLFKELKVPESTKIIQKETVDEYRATYPKFDF